MTGVAIIGGRAVTPSGVVPDAVVVVDGRIATIGDRPAGGSAEVIDATGLWVVPGMIDLQINGGFGHDVATDAGAVWSLARELPRTGVTAFLPTVISSPMPRVQAAQQALATRPEGPVGAEPLGLHLEGPMLNPSRAGAHPLEHLRDPSPGLIAGWSPDSGIAMVTIAPELSGAVDVIRTLVGRGVAVALGHSAAGAAEAAEAAEAGARHVTHLFHGMEPFHHRAPGLVGFALAERRVSAGLIVDGIHSDPTAIAAAWNAKGPQGLALVSDAVAAMGMPEGGSVLGDRSVTVERGAVRTEDGALAGTTLTMADSVRNLIAFTGCELGDAIEAATATPARVLDLTDRGRLRAGARADVVLLDDSLDVVLTMVGGRTAFDPHGLTDT